MENQTEHNFKPVVIFLSITLVLSSIFYFLIINSGTLKGGNGLYVLGLMWCPGVSALITMKLLKRNLRELGWKWGKTKYQIWSYIIPIAYAVIAYLIIWSFDLGKFYNKEFVTGISNSFGLGALEDKFTITLYVFIFGIFGIIPSAISALGEEIGWRGFLVPELFKSQGFTKTSLISGLIWGIWHLPILLFADYNSGTPAWYAMTCFMLLVISSSFIYTWFRLKSGSIWTAVILHGCHNLFIQRIFTPLTENTGNTAYYIDEFGIILPVVVIGIAIYFWTKRKELNSLHSNV